MSQQLVRLTYASTATFESDAKGGIEAEVARILLQSRKNNPKNELGGVLHYGNGYFFQCLEGPRDHVNRTYQKLLKDPRHKNVQVLTTASIKDRLFKDWSMKYLALEENLSQLLKARGQTSFNPYALDEQAIDELLEACVSGKDPIAELGASEDKHGDNSLTRWWKSFWAKA
jgi:hypothetical protein